VSPLESQTTIAKRSTSLRIAWAIFAIALLGATWKLWSGQSEFPQVPLLSWGHAIPRSIDRFCFILALLCCFFSVIPGIIKWRFALYLGFVVGIGIAVVANQHRLQPWAYQFLIMSVIFAACSDRHVVRLNRLLLISVYLYSALSKFDYQFLHTVGQQFLDTLAGFVGVDVQGWPVAVRVSLALLFPVAELIIGISLLLPRFRHYGMLAALLMHATVLAILGPFGLSHQPGVLIWNCFFMTEVVVLFYKSDAVTDAGRHPIDSEDTSSRTGTRIAYGLVFFVLLLPLLEPLQRFDHWPSWAVYAPRSSRVRLQIHRSVKQQLPESLLACLEKTDENGQWLLVRLDRWSLDTLAVPVYPQSRFQLGAADELIERWQIEGNVTIMLQETASRYTGERHEANVTTYYRRDRAHQQFWFNSLPRP